MKCPKCSTDKDLAITTNALIMGDGPEGPLHEITCITCGWKGRAVEIPKNLKREV